MNPNNPNHENPELALLTASVTAYCTRALPRSRLRQLREHLPPFALKRWREMADMGWLGLVVPDTQGGLGLGLGAAVAVGRALGAVAAGEPLVESAVACGALLASCPSAAAPLQALLNGTCIFTCPLQPSDWRAPLNVVATRKGAGYVLTGYLPSLPIAPDAQCLLLPAVLEGEPALFLVGHDAPGLSIVPHPLADGSRDGAVHLTAVACPVAARLAQGPALLASQQRALALAGIVASAYLTGLSEALLNLTLDYLRTRQQFGRALGSFQALQHRVVDLYLRLRLSTAALAAAVDAADNLPPAALALASTQAKHRAAATTTAMVREAIQLHGAIAYTEPCDVSLYVQRALVMSARYSGARASFPTLPALGLEALDEETSAALPPPLPDHHAPPNGDWNELPDPLFRSTVRHWVAAHYPAALRHRSDPVRWAEIADWHAALVARGWAAPTWPRVHGGMALAPNKTLIFIEELERWGVARAPDQGIVMIGPILMQYGTPEQRTRYLPGALSGQEIWCQGYSEPNAGSDLASLRTRAVLDGDTFIVNGQKTWTTHGLDATHMYCLVRTDPNVKPQAGISFLLVDLKQPGVSVRPIVNLAGHAELCEVFLDEVRVPITQMVGGLHQGWSIAKSLLGHERLFVGSPKLCQQALQQLRALGRAAGLAADPVFMETLARITLDVRDLAALYAEYADLVKQGGTPGADVAILKIWSTETYVRLSEMILEVAGATAGHRGKRDVGEASIDVLAHFYNARPAPIYAGSNEIQRNIIAKQVLGLPT